MKPLEWDARTYDALPLPHKRWGSSAIEKLNLNGNETVIDFGCGTGRDAEVLLGLIPNGRVIAVDASQQMLDQLRVNLFKNLDRVTILHSDIRDGLKLPQLADAALSVATLHWLPNHESVFRTMAGTLRSGARLSAECGGAGNIANVRKVLREVSGAEDGKVWNFANVEDTRNCLESAGFIEIEVRLVPDPAKLERGEQLESFLATVVLASQLREIAIDERREFVSKVASMLPEPEIDYVRLQIEAVRA